MSQDGGKLYLGGENSYITSPKWNLNKGLYSQNDETSWT